MLRQKESYRLAESCHCFARARPPSCHSQPRRSGRGARYQLPIFCAQIDVSHLAPENSTIVIRQLGISVHCHRVHAVTVYADTQLPDNNRGIFWSEMRDIYLRAENGQLVASPAPRPTGLRVTRWRTRTGEAVAALSEPVAFFLPEHAVDSSRRKPSEELWVEVTVPAKGPPRPIRLAVKYGD